MKVGILSENQAVTAKPRDFVSVSGAESMCRRLTHVRISKYLIQAVSPKQYYKTLKNPVNLQGNRIKISSNTQYVHHIEPRIQSFGLGDSQWMLYINSYIPFEQ